MVRIKGITPQQGRVIAFASTILVAVPAILSGCDSSAYQLNDENINTILTNSFNDLKNVPKHACISLPEPGVKLPGNTDTKSLIEFNSNIRWDVKALIDAGLITVKFNSSTGPSALQAFRKKAGIKTTDSPDVSLSYVALTPLGKTFYRYDDPKMGNLPQGLYGENRFCAFIKYGGAVKYMDPQKNPFDDNPNLVSWVDFKWKVDENRTPWLKNPELKDRLTTLNGKDGWVKNGILLELYDNGWGLGNDPYTIRW